MVVKTKEQNDYKLLLVNYFPIMPKKKKKKKLNIED